MLNGMKPTIGRVTSQLSVHKKGEKQMDAVFRAGNAVFNYRVAGVWVNEGHVLLHRDVNDTNWALPGGRVKLGESSIESLAREFHEELDVAVEVGSLYWMVENFFPYQTDAFHEVGFYYQVSAADETLLAHNGSFHGAEGERLLYKWVRIDALETVELYPAFLRTALKQLPKNPEHIVTRQAD